VPNIALREYRQCGGPNISERNAASEQAGYRTTWGHPLNFPVKSVTLSLAVFRDAPWAAVLAFEGSFMLRPEVLATLCCPEDRSALSLVGESLITEINTIIRHGRLRNRAGQAVEHRIDGGLLRADGGMIYPIIEGIPVLVRDEAIPIAQLGHKLADE
jgi:uncharacterized protein YbaR (Trm112 family)